MPRHCSVCTGVTALELKHLNRDLRAGVPAETLGRQYGLHPSSIHRHGLNHLERGPIRDIKISESESAYDQIGSLADSLRSAEAVRIAAIRRNQGALALRAAQTERQLSKVLFEDLGLTALSTAEFIRDANTFGRAVYRLLRARPDVADLLAEELFEAPEMADEVRAYAASGEKENVA